MYLISFYVPLEHAEKVKNAMFDAGAGHIGNYDRCAWQTLGKGQFRPLKGSSPFIGTIHQTEQLDELKVEMVCEESKLSQVIAALRTAHPYETPAFHVIRDMSQP